MVVVVLIGLMVVVYLFVGGFEYYFVIWNLLEIVEYKVFYLVLWYVVLVFLIVSIFVIGWMSMCLNLLFVLIIGGI